MPPPSRDKIILEELFMKKMRRFAAFVAAMAMVGCMAVPMTGMFTASAYDITITNTTANHTYSAYQIFAGDLDEENGVLSNIVWGSGVDGAALLTALKADTTTGINFSACTDAASVAKALEGASAEATDAFAALVAANKAAAAKTSTAAAGTQTITGLDAGYYLVMDATTMNGVLNEATTKYIIKVVKDQSVDPKSAAPSVDKQVLDETGDAEEGSTNGWGESADHSINESFQFKLTATLEADADYADYDAYKVVFKDTMSDSITFESIASVKVSGADVAADDYSYTASANQKGGSWTLTIADITKYDTDLTNGATIEVVYNAHLNEDAKIGNVDTNKNTVYLQYSNNPNVGGEGELGQTETDTVWVFTYQVENTKVDGDKEPMNGAGFKLYADENCAQEIGLIYDATLKAYRPIKDGETAEEMKSGKGDAEGTTSGKFNIVGLDAGSYWLSETTVPVGYNKCDNIAITITAEHIEGETKATATTDFSKSQNTVNEIINQQGSTLPSTGGIGTTIFYVVGGTLVAGAGVSLIAKKRMKNVD